jgi:23S rRNA U2552 (ribose-2'-O)-methylase RlmE/FtsJ
MNLKTVFDNHTDKFCIKWSHYFDIYDRYLQRFIGQDLTLIEIGVSNGGSLQLWKKYFGDKVRVIGIDNDLRTMYDESQIETYYGNQSDTNFLDGLIKKIGHPDIVIDDGSHDQIDILNSFGFLWPRLKNNGVYLIEDLHTAYSSNHNGGITSPFNFVTIASRFVHDVNISWISEVYTPTLRDLKSISFYDSMLVLEKEHLVKKEPLNAGIIKIPGV